MWYAIYVRYCQECCYHSNKAMIGITQDPEKGKRVAEKWIEEHEGKDNIDYCIGYTVAPTTVY